MYYLLDQSNFESFCGSVFWDQNLTWDTQNLAGNETLPDFTKCFQYTVASWVPCGMLWLCFPFYAYYLSRCDDSLRQNLTTRSAAKSIFAVLLACIALFDLGYTVATRTSTSKGASYFQLPAAAYLSASLNAASMLLTAVLIQLYRIRGQFTSAILWFYWSLWVLGSAVPLYSLIERAVEVGYIENSAEFTVAIVYFTLVLVEFVLSCISDANSQTRERLQDTCPEFLASFSSYVTYDWLTPTVVLGYKKSLEKTDLWKLPPRDLSSNHVPGFERDWEKSIREWRQKLNAMRGPNETAITEELEDDANSDEHDTATIIRPQPSTSKTKEPNLSLVKIIIKNYGGIFVWAWACKFVKDWLQFVDPKIQKELIGFVTLRQSAGNQVPLWHGYVLSVGFLLSQLIQTGLFQQLWYLSIIAGMHIRASLISVIYKKALRMSAEGRKESTVGEIVNLMAVDAQRVQDVSSFLWTLWSAPLQIAIALWQLYEVIGPSLFAGFAVMVLIMPVNGRVAVKQRNLQIQQMKLKDERIKLMNEVLGGIKVIKLYAWEPSFEEKLTAIRDKEMDTVKKSWYYRAIQVFGFTALPFIVTTVTFAVYVSLQEDHVLSPQVAFVSLSLFNILRIPLNLLPMMLSYVVMSSVSVKRLVKFFKTTNLREDSVHKDDDLDVSLRISNGTFSWLPDSQPILRDINMEVPTGSLTAIVGQVGSGKSSLLSACVGDLYKKSGRVVIKGSVAFAAQQAWIQNATVRDNITFGLPYDEEKYNKIVDAVSLQSDFDILDNGDLTLIGEKGINLSGGQKQRVSLARACYSEADLYYLDDPLSAVDAHVGKHIFDNVVGPNGLLKDKTRVLVTHGVHWLPYVDNIIVLKDGTISECGSYDALLSHNGAFAEFLKTFFLSSEEGEEAEADGDEGIAEVKKAMLQRLESVCDEGDKPLTDLVEEKRAQRQLSKQKSRVSESARISESEPATATSAPEPAAPARKKPQQAQEIVEAVEEGNVSWRVYGLYIKSMGLCYAVITLIQIVLYAGASIYSNIWLSQWTEDPVFTSNTSSEDKQSAVNKYLGVYGGLGGIQTFLVLGYTFSFAECSVNASSLLHRLLLSNIMKARMSFFDTKPLGQILNRFSKDMDTVDNILGFNVIQLFSNILGVVGTIFVIAYSTPIFLVVVLPMAILYYFIQKFFIPTTRQLKRLESVTRSPVYTHFSETITGAQTIRAYNHQSRFENQSERMVDENIVFFFAGWAANRWLAIRLEILAALIVFLTAIFCVLSTQIDYLKSHINPSLVGLAITYALSSTASLNFLIRNISDLESNIVSVERIKEYSEVTKEAAWENHANPPPNDWPQQGQVQFTNYATRYRAELELVLHDVTVSINPQEKIGIVGRTGAGKSSMTLALFRLLEAAKGSIIIDGVNIGNIGLHQLRRKITILPQDPVLFSGSMRSNLDPFNEYSDDRLWQVLEQSYLKEYVEKQAEKLEYECGEGGQNLSVGQRQLVCLARALLRKTKILVLDEATAAVDLETDDLIQKTIRTAFADCTILTIAHRLNTIIDSTRILVLSRGRVAEFDTPDNLLANDKSVFYGMAKDAGIV